MISFPVLNVPVSNGLISACFFILILLGIFVVVCAFIGYAKRDSQSNIEIPVLKIKVSGPAWLVSVVFGAVMVATPILLGSFQLPPNVTAPPSVQRVQRIAEPNYKSFVFVRDASILDLRAIDAAPWYTSLPGYALFQKKPHTNPGVLKNYMIIKKIDTASKIHITYSTSGSLDVRCPTHVAAFNVADKEMDGKVTQTVEVVADVSSIPVGQEFEMLIEATYWNAFAGSEGDNYTTYAHNQTLAEDISIIVLFPPNKPFKSVSMLEFAPDSTHGTTIQGPAKNIPGSQNQTYYWEMSNDRPNYYYQIAWKW
jgi:hypothetical protein